MGRLQRTKLKRRTPAIALTVARRIVSVYRSPAYGPERVRRTAIGGWPLGGRHRLLCLWRFPQVAEGLSS